MNGQILRYLALNGPSLIYSVAKDLGSRSQTKVHYPTVNRRIHELLRQRFVEKSGTRITKAGVPADLYTTTLRGDFTALAGIPDSTGQYSTELSPKEIRQIIEVASARQGSPFVLFKYILDEGQSGVDLVEKELLPAVVDSLRNGLLNIDALHEGVISSAFASLVARRVTKFLSISERHQSARTKEKHRDQIDIVMRCLEKIMAPPGRSISSSRRISQKDSGGSHSYQIRKKLAAPTSLQWGNEFEVFLKLHSVMLD